MVDTASPTKRAIVSAINGTVSFRLPAASAISPYRLLAVDTNGKVAHAAADSVAVVGASKDGYAANFMVDVFSLGLAVLETDLFVDAGQPLKAGASGKVLPMIDTAGSGVTMKATTGNGAAFTNQPANDAIEVLSSDNADIGQIVTLIGTTTGTDDVVAQNVTLNGTTFVASAKSDWGVLLAVKLSAVCAGTVTVREASANQTIVTLATTVLSAGVETVTAANQRAYNVAPTIVADGASTKQVGILGTNSAGTAIYDSQALNGTTAVTMNSAFRTVTELYNGDVENTVDVTLKTGASESLEKRVGIALEDQAVGGDTVLVLLRG